MPDEMDRRNRESLKDLNSRYLEPPLTVSDILAGQWGADTTDQDIEDDYDEQQHEEMRDKKRGSGQG